MIVDAGVIPDGGEVHVRLVVDGVVVERDEEVGVPLVGVGGAIGERNLDVVLACEQHFGAGGFEQGAQVAGDAQVHFGFAHAGGATFVAGLVGIAAVAGVEADFDAGEEVRA